MTLRLNPRQVEKPWGREILPAPFENQSGDKVGEIWFESDRHGDLPFLVKYIFTSERLSVQVHPDDSQAKSRGEARGKTECWYVIDADEGAEIGVGTVRDIAADELRSAATDGSIMDLIDWRKVAKGDFFYVPAGTIHAIGAGVSLLEFQQNSDITYRLFDYGRPRELHLDDAVAVASASPYLLSNLGSGGAILHSGSDFTVVEARSTEDIPAVLADRHRWVVPLAGEIYADGVASLGDCLLLEPGEQFALAGEATVLVGAEGSL